MDINAFEDNYVTKVYNQIAHGFSRTRKNPWPQVVKFLQTFPGTSTLGDIGCGNGRFMKTRLDCKFEGCDGSTEMVKLCTTQGLSVKYGNLLELPYPDNHFDGLICIAVLHHLASDEHRKQSIIELIRIVKPGGRLLLEVWSFEESIGTRFKFEQATGNESFTEQDKLLAWNEPNESVDEKNNKRLRYYHLFKKEEFLSLLPSELVNVNECFLDHGNWFVDVSKV
jgi:SAM-dependent methyltransferase